MGREAALVTTWSGGVRGREKESLETFMDYLMMAGKQAAEGTTAEPQVFLKYDGSGGLGIVQGQSDKLLEIWESDEFSELISKAQLTVRDLRIEMYSAGDAVQEVTSNYGQVAATMGFM
jgi:hypothetical protein